MVSRPDFLRPPVPADVTRALAALDVSRETTGLLERYVSHLITWQRRINLVSPGTLDEIWSRHILDSAQLFRLGGKAKTWLDLGSGGGLPGIVIACLLRDQPGARIDLVESNRKKAAFLQFVSADLDLPAQVHATRIESTVNGLPRPSVVTARALAPLGDLLGYTNLLLKSGATGLFPKGREHREELTDAGKDWHFSYQLHDSLTDPEARIIELAMG